jgi:hypothetical protein
MTYIFEAVFLTITEKIRLISCNRSRSVSHARATSNSSEQNCLTEQVKGKGHPLRVNSGASRERRYSPYHSLTTALEGGEWSASRPGHALPPVPIVQELGWAPEPVWTQRLEEKSSASVGDRNPAVQPVVRHCTD